MIENLETLLELQKQGTMARTGTVLRVSQSAVSKRISAIEAHFGTSLIERSGRRVALTDEGLRLVERLGPLLVELREALSDNSGLENRRVALGVSESILSSWGAQKLEKTFQGMDLQVEYHSHRSPVVIEKVEAGIYDLGLCSGKIRNPRSLVSEFLASEEMVLVASSFKRLQSSQRQGEILSIERSSATWKSIENEVKKRNLSLANEVESFFSIGQLAKAGYGVGLIPIGVASALKVNRNCIGHLKPKLFRPIQIVYKKTLLERSYFATLISEIKKSFDSEVVA